MEFIDDIQMSITKEPRYIPVHGEEEEDDGHFQYKSRLPRNHQLKTILWVEIVNILLLLFVVGLLFIPNPITLAPTFSGMMRSYSPSSLN